MRTPLHIIYCMVNKVPKTLKILKHVLKDGVSHILVVYLVSQEGLGL